MKMYEVEVALVFSKTIHVQAPTKETAKALAEAVVLRTDALPLTDEDLVDVESEALCLDPYDDDYDGAEFDDEDDCEEDYDEDEEETDPYDLLEEAYSHIAELGSIVDAMIPLIYTQSTGKNAKA